MQIVKAAAEGVSKGGRADKAILHIDVFKPTSWPSLLQNQTLHASDPLIPFILRCFKP